VHALLPDWRVFKLTSRTTLPETTRNLDVAVRVDALLVEAGTLGLPGYLLTRRQARKALRHCGTLLPLFVQARKAAEKVSS
jgi:hypothetical protein